MDELGNQQSDWNLLSSIFANKFTRMKGKKRRLKICDKVRGVFGDIEIEQWPDWGRVIKEEYVFMISEWRLFEWICIRSWWSMVCVKIFSVLLFVLTEQKKNTFTEVCGFLVGSDKCCKFQSEYKSGFLLFSSNKIPWLFQYFFPLSPDLFGIFSMAGVQYLFLKIFSCFLFISWWILILIYEPQFSMTFSWLTWNSLTFHWLLIFFFKISSLFPDWKKLSHFSRFSLFSSSGRNPDKSETGWNISFYHLICEK